MKKALLSLLLPAGLQAASAQDKKPINLTLGSVTGSSSIYAFSSSRFPRPATASKAA